MPFRAVFDGQQISALNFDEAAWRALEAQARAAPSTLQLRCCRTEAVPCTSPLGRHFFRHRVSPENCNWQPESEEHRDLKEQIAEVVEKARWAAEVEAIGNDWKADVLATRGKARIAFEVQLSPQGQAITTFREERYEASDVLPWWIVGARNGGSGFGSKRVIKLNGGTADKRAAGITKDIGVFLQRIEDHVEIARALKRALRTIGLVPAVESIGGIPSVFRLSLDEGVQPIVIGEIGPGAIRDFDTLQKQSAEAPWGAVAQFVKSSRQIKGFGATAFFLKSSSMEGEIAGIIERMVAGGMRWIGNDDCETIEAACVWYDDRCTKCQADMIRVPFLVCAHRKVWPKRPPNVVQFSTYAPEVQERTIKRLELRLGRPVGGLVHDSFGQPPAREMPLPQICLACGHTNKDSLISAADAIHWPESDVDLWLKTEAMEQGWRIPKAPSERPLPSASAWQACIDIARKKREDDEAEQERRRRQLEAERRTFEERLKALREEAQAKAAAEKEAALRAAAKLAEEVAARRKLDAENARAEKLTLARDRLGSLALSKFRDTQLASLWMNSYDPKLRGRPFDICGERLDDCQKRLAGIQYR